MRSYEEEIRNFVAAPGGDEERLLLKISKIERQLAFEKKNLLRKQEGSHYYLKQETKIAKKQEKLDERRKDFYLKYIREKEG